MSSFLPRLFHHRWTVPILAELGRRPGRFSNLAHALGVGRESLGRALESLIELRLVARNPGYGHPLRPEYLLLPPGARIAPACARLVGRLESLDALELGLKKWSLPIVHALGPRPARFSTLRDLLPDATPRALALSLKDLAAAGLVERTVVDGYPPGTVYALRPRTRPLVPPLRAIASMPERRPLPASLPRS